MNECKITLDDDTLIVCNKLVTTMKYNNYEFSFYIFLLYMHPIRQFQYSVTESSMLIVDYITNHGERYTIELTAEKQYITSKILLSPCSNMLLAEQNIVSKIYYF
jgi:hypothetical protein